MGEFSESDNLQWHTTVLFAPSVVGLFGDADLPAGFGDRNTLVDVDLSFPQLVDNLFRRMRFLYHDLPPFIFSSSLTSTLDYFLGGRPRA